MQLASFEAMPKCGLEAAQAGQADSQPTKLSSRLSSLSAVNTDTSSGMLPVRLLLLTSNNSNEGARGCNADSAATLPTRPFCDSSSSVTAPSAHGLLLLFVQQLTPYHEQWSRLLVDHPSSWLHALPPVSSNQLRRAARCSAAQLLLHVSPRILVPSGIC